MQPQFTFPGQDDDDLKRSYAAALLRIAGDNRYFEAAIMLMGGGQENIGKALWIATNWPSDPVVIKETQILLRSEGLKDNTPSKAQAAMKAWDMANESRSDAKDRIAGLKLFCEIQGFIEKPGTTVNVPVNIASNVMLVKDHGDADEWERKLAAQQDELTNASGAATKH